MGLSSTPPMNQPTLPDLKLPSVQTCSLKPIQKQLELLLKIGCSKEVIASLLEIGEFSIQHIRWFASPIIVHQSSWADTLPNWLITAIYQERLAQIFTEHEKGEIGELATPAEVLACLYPASMEAPMSSDWSRVYFWTGDVVMSKYNRLPPNQSFWDVIGSPPISYNSIQYDFEYLARDLRQRCLAESKRRGWGKKRKSKPTELITSPPSQSEIIQLSLF